LLSAIGTRLRRRHWLKDTLKKGVEMRTLKIGEKENAKGK
jgi:hypothetical protein